MNGGTGSRGWVLLAVFFIVGCKAEAAPAPVREHVDQHAVEARCEAVRSCLQANLPNVIDDSGITNQFSNTIRACLRRDGRDDAPITSCLPYTFATDKRNDKKVEVYMAVSDPSPTQTKLGVRYVDVKQDECNHLDEGEPIFGWPGVYIGCSMH